MKRYLFFILLFLAISSAKVLKIEGYTADFYSGNAVNGSFMVFPKGEIEKNVSGQIINGFWQTEIDIDEGKAIMAVTNTSSKIGFNVFNFRNDQTICKNSTIIIRPVVFNETPVILKMEIEDTPYKNLELNIDQDNFINVCLEPGKIYKINLLASKGFYSFFYPGK